MVFSFDSRFCINIPNIRSQNMMTTAYFSCHQSDSKTSVVWKIGNFSRIHNNKSRISPYFFFGDIVCRLQVENQGNKDIIFSLGTRLVQQKRSSTKLRLKSYLRNRNGLTVSESSYGPFLHRRFYGFKRMSRSDLLHGRLDVLPGDILTIHCELEELKEGVDEKDEEDNKEESSVFCMDAFSTPFLEEFQHTFESGKFSDVTLRVGGETFRCHKAILSAHSKVFEAMFDNDMKESRENAIFLMDIDVEVAKTMLLYIYTRRTGGLRGQKILDLYEAADRYMLSELKEKCREFVLNHLCIDNVCEVAEVADLYSDDILTESVERFLSSNLRKILVTEKWTMRLHEKPSLYAKLLSVSVVRHDCV